MHVHTLCVHVHRLCAWIHCVHVHALVAWPHLTGGGNGWAAPRYGSGSDNVLAYKVLLPRHPPGEGAEGAEGPEGSGPRNPGGEVESPLVEGQAGAITTCSTEGGDTGGEGAWVDARSDPELFALLQGAGVCS